MKNANYYTLLGCLLSFALQAAPYQESDPRHYEGKKYAGSIEEKFNIMERNQNEDTDTLAIPFDDSEVENEEQINQDLRKNDFALPHAPKS